MTATPQLELLPSEPPAVRLVTLPLQRLSGYEHARPRRELIEQIRRLGVLQPVIAADPGKRRPAVLVEGRRRTKAVAIIAAEAATPPLVPTLLVSGAGTDSRAVLAAVALALHASRGPSPASELDAIEAILTAGDDAKTTVKQIAAQTGMPLQTVRRRLRLRSLIPALRAAFDHGELGATAAEAAARLPAEQQGKLAALLADGQPVSERAVRELTRERTASATLALPDNLFAEQEPPWRATVRGHIQAALAALPADEDQGILADALTRAAGYTNGHPPAQLDSDEAGDYHSQHGRDRQAAQAR